MTHTVDDQGIQQQIEAILEDVGMSGTVRLDIDGRTVVQMTRGFAHRGLGVANSPSTQFGTASGAKGFTALVVMTMVERGEMQLDTTARSLLADDLPLIDDRVTVEHLLTHQSGIGDYFDEDVLDDPFTYILSVPPHQLLTTEDYLRVLEGHPSKFAPGDRFSYSNGGFVVLALLVERASGMSLHQLVEERVCVPAAMADTAFLRSDELPGRAALGYLEADGLRTNILHLPLRGTGDGGIYTTAADMLAFWDSLFAGRFVSTSTLSEIIRPHADSSDDGMQYGLGFWLDPSHDAIELHGFDPGVGFVSTRALDGCWTLTILSNQTRGTWPVRERILALPFR